GDPVPRRAFERFRSVGRHHPYMLEPPEDVDPLDRPGPDGAAADLYRAIRAPGGPHRKPVHLELDVDPLGGRDAVAAARLDRVEHGFARQRFGEHAGETAICAERRGARMAGAWPALVAVGVGDDAALVALLDRVLQKPLEATPV